MHCGAATARELQAAMREEAPSALNTSEEEDAAALEPTEDAAAPPTKRGRHRVLACATLASIINAFMFMNFSPIVELSRRRFRATEGQVSWLYSAALLATLPCLFQCMNQIVAARLDGVAVLTLIA